MTKYPVDPELKGLNQKIKQDIIRLRAIIDRLNQQ